MIPSIYKKQTINLLLISLFCNGAILAEKRSIKGKIIPVTQKKDTTPLKTISGLQHIKNISKIKSKNNKKQNPVAKKTDKEYILNVTTTLGDNRIITGKLPLKAPEKLIIQHFKEGVAYEKEISINDIEKIETLQWSGSLVAKKKQGDLYRFSPKNLRLTLKNKQVLKTSASTFAFLNQFPVFNKNGKVYLYSFWLDLQKKDGTWFTGLVGPVHSRRICHKDVVQKITFTHLKKDGQSKKDKK